MLVFMFVFLLTKLAKVGAAFLRSNGKPIVRLSGYFLPRKPQNETASLQLMFLKLFLKSSFYFNAFFLQNSLIIRLINQIIGIIRNHHE